MNYFDVDGNYDKNKVIEGIIEVDRKAREEFAKEDWNPEEVTRLRYEQMLRSLYLFNGPYNE